jgi:hypothetical protein
MVRRASRAYNGRMDDYLRGQWREIAILGPVAMAMCVFHGHLWLGATFLAATALALGILLRPAAPPG